MKKFFCLFSVVLILIIAAVPSFAVQPSFTYSFVNRLTGNLISFDLQSDGSYLCTVSDVGDVYLNFYGSPLVNESRSYLISCKYSSDLSCNPTVLANVGSGFLYLGSPSLGSNFSTVFTGSFSRLLFDPANMEVGYEFTLDYFTVIDLNSIYGDNIPDLSTIQSDLNGIYNAPLLGGNHYYSSFLNFYSHLPEVFHFDFFTSFGYFPLIAGTVIISLLLIVFVVAMVIRRCRNI